MRVRLVLIALALLSLAAPALAHRLDEYLQATTIAVAREHVAIRLHLTPGADIARGLLAAIDADGDGAISAAEQRAYVEQVRRDLTLTVDGSATPLRLVSASFPPVAAMRAGSGDMLIAFEAGVPATGSRHRLTFENRHRNDIAVYLVNTLLPDDPAIRVVAQLDLINVVAVERIVQCVQVLAVPWRRAERGKQGGVEILPIAPGRCVEVDLFHSVLRRYAGSDLTQSFRGLRAGLAPDKRS